MPDQQPAPIRVITFNTAVGNPAVRTAGHQFLDLPFYREVIEGSPTAPILALQEVGPDQARALRRAAEGELFRMVHIARPGQGNALLIPGRFELLERRSRYFGWCQLKVVGAAVWRAVRSGERANHRQLLELRMWSRVRLGDRLTGCDFTVFNTHLSGHAPLRVAQAGALLRRVHAARRRGPVILAGDLNTRPSDRKSPEQSRADAAVRALLPPLRDMAQDATDPRRPAIDYVLASGFSSVGARLYTDDSLRLPGLPSAELISDHYAKEAVLRFDAPSPAGPGGIET